MLGRSQGIETAARRTRKRKRHVGIQSDDSVECPVAAIKSAVCAECPGRVKSEGSAVRTRKPDVCRKRIRRQTRIRRGVVRSLCVHGQCVLKTIPVGHINGCNAERKGARRQLSSAIGPSSCIAKQD